MFSSRSRLSTSNRRDNVTHRRHNFGRRKRKKKTLSVIINYDEINIISARARARGRRSFYRTTRGITYNNNNISRRFYHVRPNDLYALLLFFFFLLKKYQKLNTRFCAFLVCELNEKRIRRRWLTTNFTVSTGIDIAFVLYTENREFVFRFSQNLQERKKPHENECRVMISYVLLLIASSPMVKDASTFRFPFPRVRAMFKRLLTNQKL